MGTKVTGVKTKDIDNFDFHATKYENSGKPGDKGTRESSNYVAKNGGWVKDTSTTHKTNQNEPKGSSERHPK